MGLLNDLGTDSEDSYLDSSLNDRQREAVVSTEGPLMILAGAGSGKTKTLTSRICYLIQKLNVPPHQILAVTFTNKAAGEMRERVEKKLGIMGPASWNSSWAPRIGHPQIGTFHSVCIRILRAEMAAAGFTKPFVIYDDSDQLSLIKRVLHRLNIDEKSTSPKAIQFEINRAKCESKEPKDVVVEGHSSRMFERNVKIVFEEYQKDLLASNALDFGEIICLTYRILRDFPEIRKKYQQRYRYLHVDEYQDTNRAQFLLLSMLASPVNGGHRNICVVGDEDQSIYKWRGADIRNIRDFEKEFPGAKVVKLEQNYRSTQTILAVASQVIRNNVSRREKTLWTENQKGRQVVRAQLPDERAEAEMVISEIQSLAGSDGRSYSDFAIFYRTNAQSRQFEDVLRREKIPYQIVGGLKFYDRKEIKDILGYFKLILNSSDSISLKRIINVPARGIGKTTVEKLEQAYLEGIRENRTLTLWDVLEKLASGGSGISAEGKPLFFSGVAKKLSKFVGSIQKMMAAQPRLLLSELYHLILDETSYVQELRQEGTEEALSRIQNLEEFNSLILEFEEGQLRDLSEAEQERRKGDLLSVFIEQSSLASDTDQMETDSSSVRLMTLHSSKGLEFPVVFMVGLEEGLFPSIRGWESPSEEEIEEERRLCYVGMTRAREELYLMNVMIRRIWGNVSYQQPSRFFMEMGEEFIEVRKMRSMVSRYRV